MRRVIEDVKARVSVDSTRVYLTGFSNGGMLAWRYAAEHPDEIAGVAPVGAAIAGLVDAPETPPFAVPRGRVPLIALHGLEDPRIPASEVEASLAFWAAGSGCATDPEERRQGGLRVREWQGCGAAAPVVAYALEGWGHRWPGPHFSGERTDALRDFDGAVVLWDFFAALAP